MIYNQKPQKNKENGSLEAVCQLLDQQGLALLKKLEDKGWKVKVSKEEKK